jgi:hypothetical protein
MFYKLIEKKRNEWLTSEECTIKKLLQYALKAGKPRYDRMCFMIRAKAFKAYKEGRWNIHDLFEFNIAKIKQNNYCWYCGKEMDPSKLTKDHVFLRAKGGADDLDNIIMVCKECNSSKGKMDLFEWYATIRKQWPPVNVLVHYLKNIYLYSVENRLMDKHSEDLDVMDLPFKWQYFPSTIHNQWIIGQMDLVQKKMTYQIIPPNRIV